MIDVVSGEMAQGTNSPVASRKVAAGIYKSIYLSFYRVMKKRSLARRRSTWDYFFPHAANRLREDINEIELRRDKRNQTVKMTCFRVSDGSRVAIGKLYARSLTRVKEMLSFNGFYEAEEGLWVRLG